MIKRNLQIFSFKFSFLVFIPVAIVGVHSTATCDVASSFGSVMNKLIFGTYQVH